MQKQNGKRFSLHTPEGVISVLGLAVLGGVFLQWYLTNRPGTVPGLLSALASAALFAAVCLGLVPGWFDSWREGLPPAAPGSDPADRRTEAGIFAGLLALDGVILLLTYGLWLRTGHQGDLRTYLEFWRCTDSNHYLEIARDWYLSEGDWDRLVQLVFLPGYPVAVWIVSRVVGYELYAGLLVSGVSFAGAGCALYRLFRLDMPREKALRAVEYLCILPGVFFFVAPMSDGLFLLLCALCLYHTRRGDWPLGCLFGGLASFTRSLGLTLLVPLVFELVSGLVWERKRTGNRLPVRRVLSPCLSLLLVPLGFAAYLRINYLVAGNPFQFMEYQRVHWYQRLGWFFSTASYQMEYAVRSYSDNPHSFWGLWLPNLVFGFGSLLLMVCAGKKLRPGYTAWFIAYYAVAYGATWLLSGPRYLLALIPLPLAVAEVTEKRFLDALLCPVCLLSGLLYLIAFVLRWQVY